MKKNLLLILSITLIQNSYTQIVDVLNYERIESTEIDISQFYESISESNRLNDNCQNNNFLYATYNHDISIGGINKLQGVIKTRDLSKNYIHFNSLRFNNSNEPISIVNCTQDGDNVLISGNFYNPYATTSTSGGPIPMSSNGILMECTNPINFQHNLVEFNFWSISTTMYPIGLSVPPPSTGTTNHFVFITDAVKDDVGNIYAVGVINTNMENKGKAFFMKLDNTLNIVDMWLNQSIYATWERVVYDNSNGAIYMVGTGKRIGMNPNPMIAKYDITAAAFDVRVFDHSEVFFDIKKDLVTNQLVVGWTEGHFHDIGLLFFDNQLNLLSERTWDNRTSQTFTYNLGADNPVSIFSSKPNSLYISNNEIFIRGAGGRRESTSGLSWYGNSYFNTNRFSYGNLNATYSFGRYPEYSLFYDLFQTMNGFHPWFPKRMVCYDSELVSWSDVYGSILTRTWISGSGLHFFKRFNTNPSLFINIDETFLYCTHNNTVNDVLTKNSLIFSEVIDENFQFTPYSPPLSDYDITRNISLTALSPNQEFCDESTNSKYKLARNNISEIKINGYKVYNMIGQLIDSKLVNSNSSVDEYLRTFKNSNLNQNGIHLIQFETNNGIVCRKIYF